LLSRDEQKRPVEDMNFTVLVPRWEQGSPRLVLKYLVPKGWLLLWAKEQDGPTPGPAPAPPQSSIDSPPPPSSPEAAPSLQPQPAVSLVGVWRSKDGEVLRMGPSTYEGYSFNQMVDKGTYEIRGKEIVIKSGLTGERERLSYRLSGKQRTLTDSRGETSNCLRGQ
jgi:hypothetical protein